MGPPPAVAAVRLAVRRELSDLEPGALVLVACSGGADSLALAAALAFEAPRAGLRAGGVTVDHRLQPGSTAHSFQVVRLMAALGLAPTERIAVDIDGPGGPEAAARAARYRALDATAVRLDAHAILLGHTRDDQAETVLLGLARGSGARSLAGMPPRDPTGRYRRPLLGLSRATVREAAVATGREPWDDPHNVDPAYTRARVRHHLLPALEAELGPGIVAALARSADQLRADAELLDGLADQAYASIVGPDTPPEFAASSAATLPAPIRRRLLHRAALAAGCPAGDLAACHVEALDALLTDWHGQSWVDLPGGVVARRTRTRLRFGSTP